MSTPAPNPSPSVEAPAQAGTRRLVSLDALRGFDMFWIIGADGLVQALDRMTHNSLTSAVASQLHHVEWEGFHFYDLIFPLFVFIVGVSLVFSLRRTIQEEGRAFALKRVIRRSILLFIIALLYSGGLSDPWPNIRLLGVLNRIALCYFFASIIFCFCRPRVISAIIVGLLVGYWTLMTFIPIRDMHLDRSTFPQLSGPSGQAEARRLFDATTSRVTGKFEPGYNLANHLDFQYLPGKRWDLFWDPEGLLSTLPAIATCLLGVLAGLLLLQTNLDDREKVIALIGGGTVALLLGFAWSLQFPVVKKIWSSSFVLVAGGYSAILLGLFYQVIDVWQKKRWCQPFVWIGMNSITIYLTSNIIGGFRKLGLRFAGGDVKTFFDQRIAAGMGDLVIALAGLGLAFAFVHFLYRRKIFLRL